MSQAPDAENRPTVLVVDDEEDLRDIMRRMLERRGFSTLVAGDSQQAVAVCRDHPGEIGILVTDLGLPGVSGGELSRQATELRPGMRVVYISGLPKEMAVADGPERRRERAKAVLRRVDLPAVPLHTATEQGERYDQPAVA